LRSLCPLRLFVELPEVESIGIFRRFGVYMGRIVVEKQQATADDGLRGYPLSEFLEAYRLSNPT